MVFPSSGVVPVESPWGAGYSVCCAPLTMGRNAPKRLFPLDFLKTPTLTLSLAAGGAIGEATLAGKVGVKCGTQM